MKEKCKELGKKLKKLLCILLIAALVCGCSYMVYAHRRVIRAAIKGEPMSKAPHQHCRGKL